MSTVYQMNDCGCSVLGEGTLQNPVRIHYCDTHAGASMNKHEEWIKHGKPARIECSIAWGADPAGETMEAVPAPFAKPDDEGDFMWYADHVEICERLQVENNGLLNELERALDQRDEAREELDRLRADVRYAVDNFDLPDREYSQLEREAIRRLRAHMERVP